MCRCWQTPAVLAPKKGRPDLAPIGPASRCFYWSAACPYPAWFRAAAVRLLAYAAGLAAIPHRLLFTRTFSDRSGWRSDLKGDHPGTYALDRLLFGAQGKSRSFSATA